MNYEYAVGQGEAIDSADFFTRWIGIRHLAQCDKRVDEMTPSLLISGVQSKVRNLRRRVNHLNRFHPVMRSLRVDAENPKFITCSGKRDGEGAQALAIMSTILFAHDAGMTYVHTPFSAPNWDNVPENLYDATWEKKWDEFFNFGEKEISRDQILESGIKCIHISNPGDIADFRTDILYEVNHCHEYANLFPSRYRSLSDIFRLKYNSSPKAYLCDNYDIDKVNIAIHVRRGWDVVRQGPMSHRYTLNDHVASVLRQVLEAISHSRRQVSIRLYSQGSLEDFGQLVDMGVEFHLDECPFSTFHSLVEADILLMAKSAFSYAAALLSKGVKIYEPFDRSGFVHNPLPDWLVVGRDGSISRRRLVRSLKGLAAMESLARESGKA